MVHEIINVTWNKGRQKQFVGQTAGSPPAQQVVQLHSLYHSLQALVALLLAEGRNWEPLKGRPGFGAGCLPDGSWRVRVKDLVPQRAANEVWAL